LVIDLQSIIFIRNLNYSTLIAGANVVSMDILYFLGGIAAMCLGTYLLYLFFRRVLEGSYFARRAKLQILFIPGLILAFGGLFTAIHHFCLIFNITR